MAVVGDFVRIQVAPYREYGIGKLVRIQENNASVAYFDTPDDRQPVEVTVPLVALRSASLSTQTRVFRLAPGTNNWQVGRVLDGDGPVLLVQFPNKEIANVSRDELQTRWQHPIKDPVAFLVRDVTETPRFSEARSAFLSVLTAQRAACLGMGTLLSSRVQLADYQFNVVKRVLQDPVQRYLLADEVGLGKTIEAGLLIRQYVLDEPKTATVMIIVPPSLVGQWHEELSRRFLLEEWLGDYIRILSSDDIAGVRRYIGSVGMLVVDEAHHLSRGDTPEAIALYELLRREAPSIQRLFLLSATPVLADTAGFLRVLHLLDPVVFSLDDLAGFEHRLKSRQLVAETVAALSPENLLVLEQELDRLENAFSDDKVLVNLVANLRPIVQSLPEEDDETFLVALSALRAHLTETYKLHRRILRNRRKFSPWATPGRSGIRLSRYNCETTAERCAVQESLRIHLSNIGVSSSLEKALFQAAVHPSCGLSRQEMLHKDGIDDEEALSLARRIDLLSSQVRQEGARSDATVSVVKKLLEREALQIVLFCDLQSVADELCSALSAVLPGLVRRHEPGNPFDGGDDDGREPLPWHQFSHQPSRCRVLVCDIRAEEGLNLHGGRKVAVHYDLPSAANRIEQRMGRLDRFGSGSEVLSIGIVCENDPDEMAWAECLYEGFQVFDSSMASLQYLVEEAMRPVPASWCGQGRQALFNLTQSLSGPGGWVESERRRIDQQDALDALGEPSNDAFDTLEVADNDWEAWREAFDLFAVHALLFQKRREHWETPLPANDQVFRLGYAFSEDRQTLFPRSTFVSEFIGTIDTKAPGGHWKNPLTYPYAYRRNTAVSREGEKALVRPLRYGDTLVEALRAFCEADDRGRVFAMWRHLPGFESKDASGVDLCLRFDFLVEAAVTTLRTTLDHERLEGGGSLQALQRRADGHFPPEFITVWVGLDGEASDAVPADLAMQYRTHNDPEKGRDYNLNARRWQLLRAQSNMPWLADWSRICEDARQRAQSFLMTIPRLTTRIADALVDLNRHHNMRQAQLAARISRLSGLARTSEEAEREMELGLHAHLVDAIATPRMRLDVAGAIFVSKQNPFER